MWLNPGMFGDLATGAAPPPVAVKGTPRKLTINPRTGEVQDEAGTALPPESLTGDERARARHFMANRPDGGGTPTEGPVPAPQAPAPQAPAQQAPAPEAAFEATIARPIQRARTFTSAEVERGGGGDYVELGSGGGKGQWARRGDLDQLAREGNTQAQAASFKRFVEDSLPRLLPGPYSTEAREQAIANHLLPAFMSTLGLGTKTADQDTARAAQTLQEHKQKVADPAALKGEADTRIKLQEMQGETDRHKMDAATDRQQYGAAYLKAYENAIASGDSEQTARLKAEEGVRALRDAVKNAKGGDIPVQGGGKGDIPVQGGGKGDIPVPTQTSAQSGRTDAAFRELGYMDRKTRDGKTERADFDAEKLAEVVEADPSLTKDPRFIRAIVRESGGKVSPKVARDKITKAIIRRAMAAGGDMKHWATGIDLPGAKLQAGSDMSGEGVTRYRVSDTTSGRPVPIFEETASNVPFASSYGGYEFYRPTLFNSTRDKYQRQAAGLGDILRAFLAAEAGGNP